MTVGEVMDALNQFDRGLTVYVPDLTDGTAQPVAAVFSMPHLNCPIGISIPNDVAMLPVRMLEESKNGGTPE